jgi:type IX secretion system PorP/SprF family membrane protein
MKKSFITLIFGAFAIAAYAQEQAIYTHYQVFPVLVNPGATAFDDKHQFLGNARSSWTGFPGQPTAYTFMYTGPVGERLALGGGLFSEEIGDINTLKLQFNYAFRFRIQKARIGLGLTTEFLNRRINADLLSNPLIDPNDDDLESLSDGEQTFDASVGAYVLYDERLFLNVALPNTVRARLDEVPVDNQSQRRSIFEHYIFHLGYIWNWTEQNMKVIPSLAFRRIRDTPFQLDLNIQARLLEDKLIGGFTYRPSTTNSSAACIIGTKYKGFHLFYSYDLSFARFQKYNNGSHELSVALTLARKTQKPGTDTSDLYK